MHHLDLQMLKWYIWVKPDPIMKPSKKGYFRITELIAVAITVALKFILMDWLGMRAFYIGGICIFWLGYVVFRYSSDHSILRCWGFKKENFGKSLRVLFPFLVISIIITIIYGKLNHIRILNYHVIPVLLLYPVWGIIQQFMLVCILVQNLQKTAFFSNRKYRVILLASCLFSLIHYPYPALMIFTFVMEMIFLIAYVKWRNLWAIGIAHGWIATFLLYYALNRDLWTELFAWF